LSPDAEQAARAEQRRASLREDAGTLVSPEPRHLLARAEDQRRVLVRLPRNEVEDACRSVRRRPAGLLGEQGQRIGLVQQAQPATPIPRSLVARIEIDAAAQRMRYTSAAAQPSQRVLKSLPRGPSNPATKSRTGCVQWRWFEAFTAYSPRPSGIESA
jgi:hypothetical protein